MVSVRRCKAWPRVAGLAHADTTKPGTPKVTGLTPSAALGSKQDATGPAEADPRRVVEAGQRAPAVSEAGTCTLVEAGCTALVFVESARQHTRICRRLRQLLGHRQDEAWSRMHTVGCEKEEPAEEEGQKAVHPHLLSRPGGGAQAEIWQYPPLSRAGGGRRKQETMARGSS